MSTWTKHTYRNDWTGEERTVWRGQVPAENGANIRTEVYELGGRLYWSAHIHIPHRPELSRIAYGTFAAIPGALAVAKGRASRVAGDAVRKVERLSLAA